MHAYHFETHTIEVFLSLWDKHSIMPLMRIAVCFDGQIFINDHIPANTLGVLAPLSHYLYHNALHPLHWDLNVR